MVSGRTSTLSKAAEIAGYRSAQAYHWSQDDPDFKVALELADEILADSIEQKLIDSPNFIPQMFLLKAIRPKYRDNYRTFETNSKLEELLTRLRDLRTPTVTVDDKPALEPAKPIFPTVVGEIISEKKAEEE